MTMKQIAIYGGFFVAVLAAALLAAGVLQHRVFARPRGQEPARAGQGGAVADAHGKKGEVSAETKAGQPGGPAQPAQGKPAEAKAVEAQAAPHAVTWATAPAALPAGAPAPAEAAAPAADKAAAPEKKAEAPPAAAERAAAVKRLARMYEGMRPKEAAQVIEKLDRPVAAKVLAEIKERQASKILGAMSPAAAAEISRRLGQFAEGDTP